MELQGLQGISDQTYLRKPETYTDHLEGLKSRLFKDSVMEPGFIESLTAPKGSPIDYDNISSVAGGRLRTGKESFIDPLIDYAKVMVRGFHGEINKENLTIRDQLTLITGMVDTAVGGMMSAPKSALKFNPNRLNMFVGPTAKEIVKAEGMAMRGASKEEIHSALLMHKKPDGFWRKEIDDSGAVVSGDKLSWGTKEDIKINSGSSARLKQILEHPEMNDLGYLTSGKDYPMYAQLKTDKKGGSFGKGWMDVDEITMGINKDSTFTPEQKNTLFHELQHAAQEKEGWARGGSPETIQRRNKYAIERIKEIETTEEYKTAFGKMKKEWSKIKKSSGDIEKKEDIIYQKYKAKHPIIGERESLAIEIGNNYDPHKAYQNLLGEREARDTASRLSMNLDKRREVMPDFGEGATLKGLNGLSEPSMSIPVYQGRSRQGLTDYMNPDGVSWGTTDKGTAEQFANVKESYFPNRKPPETIREMRGEVYNLDFDIKNPMDVDIKDTLWSRPKELAKIKEAKVKGYDGLRIKHPSGKIDYVAFDKKQVKRKNIWDIPQQKITSSETSINKDKMAASIKTAKADTQKPVDKKGYISSAITSDPIGIDEDNNELFSDAYALIEKIYVEPEYRGKGIARDLLSKEIVKISKENPDKKIVLAASQLESETDVDRLVKFYESMGFSEGKVEPGMDFIPMTMSPEKAAQFAKKYSDKKQVKRRK